MQLYNSDYCVLYIRYIKLTLGDGEVDEDLEGEDDLEVLNPKEWILLEISFEALSTTPGVLTLIALNLKWLLPPMEWQL